MNFILIICWYFDLSNGFTLLPTIYFSVRAVILDFHVVMTIAWFQASVAV
jgi:hypothetical protein